MCDVAHTCTMCGKCCYYEIPITLLDIHRMATHLDVPERDAFRRYIQDTISTRSSLFMIQKNRESACIFLTGENRCSIQQAKPRACGFYLCSLSSHQEDIPWTAYCSTYACQLMIWEHSLSAAVTRAYIERNGTRWNETDYHDAVSNIRENTLVDDDRRVKLARDNKGTPMVMVYDCSKCGNRGTVACETPVTIDDISRISAHLGMGIDDFFKRNISPEISHLTKGLKLIRHNHCIFYNQRTHCSIKEIRPMHCRFVPCPKRANNMEIQERFYLGSGSVEEQFRHQVSLEFTRQYVGECGTRYHAGPFARFMDKIEAMISNSSELERFCRKIAPYRYIDDTLTIVENSP